MAGPSRPAVTAPQIAGMLIAGIPFVAQLLHAFGVYEMTLEQQAALGDVVQWAAISAGTLFGADAALRAARNHAHAKVAQSEVLRRPLVPAPPLSTENVAVPPPVARPTRKRPTKPKAVK